MNKINNQFTSIEQVAGQYLKSTQTYSTEIERKVSFEDILNGKKAEQISGLKFSKHASMRLEERNISLTEEQNKRLQDGVEKADEKGIRESLVMIDSLAFIVNVPNKTVVTAMDQTETQDSIFTNIDGAVIM
ncbi:MAG: flagellar protein [Lachnospiraceae bacterium]|nr:flagellar protein [Lachnospiraceae bacterium]